MARNLKSEYAARYQKIQESKVNGLWVGKGEDLGDLKAFFLKKQVTSLHFSPALLDPLRLVIIVNVLSPSAKMDKSRYR